MDVKIISRETIKPSAPTPKLLRTFNLSLLDQLSPQVYIPIILFYSSPAHGSPGNTASRRLKESFSKALTVFYPLAGRIRDDLACIDCNDEGATYVEARVAGDMSSVALGQQNTLQLQQLLPCNPHAACPAGSSSQVILAVQVNYFDCGGIAIGVCLWHEAGDASTVATFAKNWAAISNRGADDNNSNIIDGVVLDCSSIFPGKDLRSFPEGRFHKHVTVSETGMKKISFSGSKIATLREKMGLEATRFEALIALLIGASEAATGKENRARTGTTSFLTVDFRKRLSPPLPDGCIGNISQAITAYSPNKNGTGDYSGTVQAIHESIKMMNNESIRYFYGEGSGLKMMYAAMMEIIGKGAIGFGYSSWCRFPFYEADFGWGKPVWFCPAFCTKNAFFFVDARDGEGIEVWVGLAKEDMEKLLRNPDILAYASFTED